jgi:hypothetical protein
MQVRGRSHRIAFGCAHKSLECLRLQYHHLARAQCLKYGQCRPRAVDDLFQPHRHRAACFHRGNELADLRGSPFVATISHYLVVGLVVAQPPSAIRSRELG